ncbi:hypothetical protein D9757_008648 [Collybiopsis confluens]|uniref:C2H2-type domain-containing protein n=1 Tax=Collybiopsis confluens TaxID=2823264 RepID=A0A8H5H4D7_9AGAR|nr:hypothetical protein D9757_008648 [Collybiopsis confluens]
MADFYNNSDYEYGLLEAPGYQNNLSQSTSYNLLQPESHIQSGSFRKTAQFDQHIYGHLMSWVQESAASISEQPCTSAVEAIPGQYSTIQSDLPMNHALALADWPTEYFISPSGAEFMPDAFETLSPSASSDLTRSDFSDLNVFDVQFGDALSSYSQGFPHHPSSLYLSGDSDNSSSSSCSSSPIPSSYEPLQLPRRTHSPASSEASSQSVSSDYRRRFPCLIAGCSRRFTSQYTLKVHMEAHKPKPKVYFPCTQGCSERFSRQHDRLRHEVAKHGKVCEFSCEDCGRFFSTAKTLGNHKCPVAQGGTRWVNA